MPKYPKIKFIVNSKEDINNCLNFINWHKTDKIQNYSKRFLPNYLYFILNSEFSAQERAKIIKAYTRNIFSGHLSEIKRNVSQTEKAWLKIAPKYYQLMTRVFKGHAWPKGDYRGIASIYNMFPRYIKDKVFFFPPNRQAPDFANRIIAHEMVHFVFFDYLKKKYNLIEDSKIKGKSDNYVWLVSEIFNFTLESWKPYADIFKNESRRQPYFGEIKLCRKMQRDWQEKQDIDWLLDKWLK